MAKWGEGDPRWIVEERPDATNVNNWHWTEKNASDWSKAKLNSLFKNLIFEEPDLGKIKVTDISNCEGEAMANNRKGKLIFFYEWNLELEWKAISDEIEEEIKGKIELTNLSEENEPHEIEINVSLTNGASKGEKYKEYIRIKGLNHIREKVKEYIQALREEYATDLILPTKDQAQAVTKQNKTLISQDLANNVKNISVSGPSAAKNKSGLQFQTTSIKLSQSFKCTAEDIYRALTVREMVCAFTRNDVKLEVEKGGKFELFGGNVTGEFVELVPNEKIVQKWRFKSWPSNHHSEAIFTITQEEETTRLDLHQTGIPISDLERTKQGWQNYYWDSIKRTFGYGAHLI